MIRWERRPHAATSIWNGINRLGLLTPWCDPGPRHFLLFFDKGPCACRRPSRLSEVALKRFPSPRRHSSFLSGNLFQKPLSIPYQNRIFKIRFFRQSHKGVPRLETQTPDSLPQIQLHLSFRPLQLFKVRRELTIALPGVFSHPTCKLMSAQVLRQTSLQLHGYVNVVGTFFALQITAKQNDSFNRTQEIIAGVYFPRALQESLECLVSRRSNNGFRRAAPSQTTSLVC